MTNVWCAGGNDFFRLYNTYERTLYDGLITSESCEAMPSTSTLKPSYRFLYKPLEDVQDGGCNASVWVPGETYRVSV